jgi:epoxyqueuosine reductase
VPAPARLSSANLIGEIRTWAAELGFSDVGIARLELDADARHLADWLRAGFHGGMAYMARNVELRSAPERLQPGTLSVISARMDHLPPARPAESVLNDGTRAYIARYALGRDYHKLLRSRLRKLAARIEQAVGPFGYRVLTDSAPALEKALGRNARLGWIGKNTLLLNRGAGSFFLLGEIYCDLPLTEESASPRNHCGTCRACLDVCPTQAIVAPYRLDARRCISYLTIENRDGIPVEFRRAVGNRVFGCDDCQLVCPWNRYARLTPEPDFAPRHGLDGAALTTVFAWSEAEYLQRTEGMALRRTTYRGWLRNVAVALGNAPYHPDVVSALQARAEFPDAMVREHVTWALAEQRVKKAG